MADFTDEDKIERTGGKYFDEGIHEVRVGLVEFGFTNDKREYCDIEVMGMENDDERTAKVRFWFHTAGAKGYSFGAIRNMFVHNASEAKKEATRTRYNAIKNTEELEAAMQKVLVGDNAQVWLRVTQDGTYKNGNGDDKPSYDRELFGYNPPVKEASKQTSTSLAPKETKASEEAEQTMADF